MGRSQETYGKKEVQSKKDKKRKEKEAKRLAKKENEKSGKLDDMMAYVDEFGNITDTPPDPTQKKVEIEVESIEIGVPKKSEIDAEDLIRKGTVTFFNDAKGFGFIKDINNGESIFVHINNVEGGNICENDKVTFDTEMGQKGPVAVDVKIVK